MKIVLLTSYLSESGGGLSYSVPGLADALRRLGADVHIVGLCEKDTNPTGKFAADGVHSCEISGPSSFGYSRALIPTLKWLNPDLINLQHMWMYPSIANMIASKQNSIPYVISPRGMLDAWALKRSRYRKLISTYMIEKSHFRNASCIHALTQSEANSVRDYGYKGDIAVIPNGVDSSIQISRPYSRKKKVLFLGRIDDKKSVVELVEAWALVSKSIVENPWRLIIAGYGEQAYIDKVLATISRNRLELSVDYIGPVFGEEKRKLLAEVSAFVLPSKSEGLPMAVLEAWSSGVVTLISEECNLPDGFEERAAIKVGITAETIAPGIRQLLNMSESSIIEIVASASSLVSRKYTRDVVGTQMLGKYEKIVFDRCQPEL